MSSSFNVLPHSDRNDLSRTAVESKSNRSCNHRMVLRAPLVRAAGSSSFSSIIIIRSVTPRGLMRRQVGNDRRHV